MNKVSSKSVRFQEGQLERMEKLSLEQERKVNWIIVRAVEEFLIKHGK
ncbi:hypothetical protein H6F51_18160 [Cyanobacteria bacterium FACHB-DQ100]|nr:hypothetical protein [Cyanobacteria bacterium FACHB-DQ100]